jgi:hypothetical protein
MNSDISEHFKEVWSEFDPDASSFMLISSYRKFLLKLGDPLGWDVTYNHNFMKQQEYFTEITLPKYNTGTEYYFMDVFENLILLMIIRREIINFAVKNKHYELLGAINEKVYLMQQD